MATVRCQTTPNLRIEHSGEHRFFTWMALVMIALSLAAFVPALACPAERHAPLSGLAAAHGILFLTWLLLFLVQSRLISGGYIALHRRLGLLSIFVLALMVPVGYTTTISMVRRGFDLSGDLRVDHDPSYEAVFPLCNLLIFALLVIAALLYRHRPQIHKRLMLFANIELMPAPLAHLIGHTPWLATMPGAIIMGTYLVLRHSRTRERLAGSEANPPAHLVPCEFADSLRSVGGRSYRFKRGLAPLRLLARAIAGKQVGEASRASDKEPKMKK